MSLTDFLLARIAEDEDTLAGAVRRGKLEWTKYDVAKYADLDARVEDHIARHDPARVLAECEAKRRIVELAEEATSLDMNVDNARRVGVRDMDAEPWLGDLMLAALALPYADHPDYREEWKP